MSCTNAHHWRTSANYIICLTSVINSFAGQSDIKKLRRENYQLRKEIWNLRDEHDRLGKLLSTKNSDGGSSSGVGVVSVVDIDTEEKVPSNVDDCDYEYDEDYGCYSSLPNEVYEF